MFIHSPFSGPISNRISWGIDLNWHLVPVYPSSHLHVFVIYSIKHYLTTLCFVKHLDCTINILNEEQQNIHLRSLLAPITVVLIA